MGRTAKNLVGLKFKKLLVLKRISSNRNGSVTWECICDCGNKTIYSTSHLTRSKSPVVSCGCFRKASGNQHKDFKGHGEIPKRWWYSRIERELKCSKKRKSLESSLTIEQAWDLFLKQNKKCSLSGLELIISNNTQINTASIDRIDSSIGYVIDNIQWVHKHINFMKRTYSQEHFISMCKKVAANFE